MSTNSSVSEFSAADSVNHPQEGLLYVTVSNKDARMTEELVEEWYHVHMDDVLSCPGNGGLFLRYRNDDDSIAANTNLEKNMETRIDASSSEERIASAQWPYLALVKVPDLAWYTSQAFNDMPRTSTIFPPNPDGSIANAFEAYYVGLRSYSTIGKGPVVEEGGRGKFLVILQTSSTDEGFFKGLDAKYASLPHFRRSKRYKNHNGYLGAQEPGVLPDGLVIYHYDGTSAPEVAAGKTDGVIRQDIWRFTSERGDLSLEM